jgi:hypothetical protein
MTDQNIDKAKGRVKEAAGALTGDRRLKNRGRVDQAKGSVKNAVDRSPAGSRAGRTRGRPPGCLFRAAQPPSWRKYWRKQADHAREHAKDSAEREREKAVREREYE